MVIIIKREYKEDYYKIDLISIEDNHTLDAYHYLKSFKLGYINEQGAVIMRDEEVKQLKDELKEEHKHIDTLKLF